MMCSICLFYALFIYEKKNSRCQDALNAVDIKTICVNLKKCSFSVIQLVLNLFDCFHNHMEQR